jgi:ATP-dependent helicase HepA
MNRATADAPDCPVCGGLMEVRVANQGRESGNSFWGCRDYPRCSGSVDVFEALQQRTDTVEPHAPTSDEQVCPDCGSPMVARVAGKGPRAGQSFWGCSRFPICRGTRAAEGSEDVAGEVAPVRAASQPPRLSDGNFVWTFDRALLGKVVSLDGDRAVVRVVHSVAHQEQRVYDREQIKRAHLSPQTRVYVVDSDDGRWIAGRVADYDLAHDDGRVSYDVLVPGQRTPVVVSERDLEVRSFAPTVDPTEVLASGGAESQFFHDRRVVALRSLLEHRNASGGATGLASASVDLRPHQLQVVRRVLDDPVQRYLLADEVGLGKTIEAGAIARQLVTDSPTARIALITPMPLMWQWERELEQKFDLVANGNQLSTFSFDELGELTDANDSYDLLIVDEAHNLVGHGGATSDSYRQLAEVAHRVERLLLLTATPVLSDQEATLALLHLLDPATYRLDDLDSFRRRLERREEFGELSLALDPEVSPVLLRATVGHLQDLLADDEDVARLGPMSIEGDVGDEQRREAVVAIRQHLSDSYRLDHRLLRTRRIDTGWTDRDCRVTVDVDDDSRALEAAALLEDWRADAADAATSEEREVASAAIYQVFFEALGAGIEEFARALQRRAEELTHKAPEFDGEAGWIQRALSRCAEDVDGMTRTELSAAVIELAISGHTGNDPVRFVAFCSSGDAVHDLVAELESLRATTVVEVSELLDNEDVEDAIDTFLSSDWPAVLVADRTAEEGLNLQAADGVIHVDLPLAPDRLEQRIGRLDRLGRTRPDIQTRVLLPSDEDDSPWLAWHQLLADGFGLYSRSISDVQFLLDDLQQRVRLAMFRRGAAGVIEMTEEIQEELEAERRRMDHQYALEQMDLESDDSQEAFTRLVRADRREQLLGDDLDGWLFEVLGFRRESLDADRFQVKWHPSTRVPERPWRARFELDLERPLTYRRAVALAHPDTRLVRPGSPLVDEALRLMRRDDRGTAFATWRTDPRWPEDRGEWLGFRLTYVVELDDESLRDAVVSTDLPFESIQRFASDLFPPWMETLNLDAQLSVVTDQLLLEILRRDYDRRGDLNLASRPDLIALTVGHSRFAAIVREVRTRSEELLLAEGSFVERFERARSRALQAVSSRGGRLERRRAALGRLGEVDQSLDQQLVAVEALRTAAEQPRLRLEAIGAFIVSHDRAPEAS